MDDLKALIAIGLIWLGVMAFQSKAFGCQWYAYEELKRQGKQIRVMPAVVVSEKSGFRDGVVSVTNVEDCRKMLHELTHHYQWERHGVAKDLAEWNWRERDAALAVRRAE